MTTQHTPPPYLQSRMSKLSGFLESFYEHQKKVECATHVTFKIDAFRLKCVFLNWVDVFEQSARLDEIDTWDYLDYLGGQGLFSLLKFSPAAVADDSESNLVTAEAQPEAVNALLGMQMPEPGQSLSDVVRHWPVGFLYISFCLSAIAKAEHREDGKVRVLTDNITDLKGFWWSFKENAAESPGTAIPFFDLLLGNNPDWVNPFDFGARDNHATAPPVQLPAG